MNILLHTSLFSRKIRNTDIRYLSSFIDGQSYFKDITFSTTESLLSSSAEISIMAFNRLLSKLGISADIHPFLYRSTFFSYLPQWDINPRKYDILLTHGFFPANFKALPPIIWEIGVLGKSFLSYHYSCNQVDQVWKIEIETKAKIGRNAALIGISYPVAAERFKEAVPSLASKVRVLPHFLPHVILQSQQDTNKKYNRDGKLQLTFIGNQARRKGLPELYQALSILPKDCLTILEISVVSAFTDGLVQAPSTLNIKIYRDLTKSEIQALLANTHIYCMPSKVEAYGFAYVEAMASGCIVIAPNREPQDYFLDHGNAGFLIDPSNISNIAETLETCIKETKSHLSKVERALHRVKLYLGPEAAAAAYQTAFQDLV